MNPHRIRCETETLSWTSSGIEGVETKLLAAESELDPTRTSLVRLDPGAYFSLHSQGLGVEVFVLDEAWSMRTELSRPVATPATPRGRRPRRGPTRDARSS